MPLSIDCIKNLKMNKLLLGLSILLLVNCGGESTSQNQSTEPETNPFQWDFSQPKTIVYTYSQTVNGENIMQKDAVPIKSFITGEGFLKIKIKENQLADLSLTDIDMTMVSYNPDGSPKDTVRQKAPASVVENMKPSGGFGATQTDVLFDLFFPLPKKNLQEGESYDIPMKVPFNVGGSQLFSKGRNQLTFLGYETLDGTQAAVLEGDIKIMDIHIPEEFTGNYESKTTGKAKYYFDMENSYFLGADIEVDFAVVFGSEDSKNDDYSMDMKVKSGNVYKIRFLKIED